MMKKLILAALFALAATGTSFAADRLASVNFVWDDVRVRTRAAANPAPGNLDSLQWSVVGAESAPSAPRDTTVAFSTEGWRPPTGTMGLTDTSGVAFILLVHDAPTLGDTESGSDSLNVCVEVSADGVTWAPSLAFKGGTEGSTTTTANDQTIVSGVFKSHRSLGGTAATPKLWTFRYNYASANTKHGADVFNLLDFPYIRFIFLYPEPTSYMLGAKVGHWQAFEN